MKVRAENDELVIIDGDILGNDIVIYFKNHVIKVYGENLSIIIVGKTDNARLIDKRL